MRRIVRVFFLIIAWSAPVFASGPVFTDDQWRGDIESFVSQLKSMHKNPWHAISEADFREAVDALIALVPSLTDQRIGLEMSRLAALIGDGHTWISTPDAIAAERLPLGMYEYADGVFVRRAAEPNSDIVSAQILAIGGKPVGELLAAAEQYTSRDNEWNLLDRRIGHLGSRTFLEMQGAAQSGDPIAIRLKRRDGTEATVRVATIPRTDYMAWAESPPQEPVGLDALPLFRRNPRDPYWMEYLPEHKAVYMKFNAVRNKPGGPHLAQFSQDLMALIDEKKADRLIIDVRNNGGGDGDMLKPLIRRISENQRINRPGRLFVITSRMTYSAALMFTVRMEKQTEALFAGEPGGGKPNSYSEFTEFSLPNTGMSGSISSRWHEEGGPGDTREYVPVDIPVAVMSADFFANHDPVLDAVLSYRK